MNDLPKTQIDKEIWSHKNLRKCSSTLHLTIDSITFTTVDYYSKRLVVSRVVFIYLCCWNELQKSSKWVLPGSSTDTNKSAKKKPLNKYLTCSVCEETIKDSSATSQGQESILCRVLVAHGYTVTVLAFLKEPFGMQTTQISLSSVYTVLQTNMRKK